MSLPPGVAGGSYRISPPLIKHSALTSADRGGVGKDLSEGWALNFAIGCTFGCPFCYVDAIHKRYGAARVGDMVQNPWGYYFALPANLQEAIDATDWKRWAGKEVMLSSTHDPFLPQLQGWTRAILERALPAGVRFCIQTRSPLVERHFDLLGRYASQLRVQVSIATISPGFSRLIEPRVVPPARRVEILRLARSAGLTTGVIIAPVFPPVDARRDVAADLEQISQALAAVRPDRVYGESLHRRGVNMAYVQKAVGPVVIGPSFDAEAAALFHASLQKSGLEGTWWPG